MRPIAPNGIRVTMAASRFLLVSSILIHVVVVPGAEQLQVEKYIIILEFNCKDQENGKNNYLNKGFFMKSSSCTFL